MSCSHAGAGPVRDREWALFLDVDGTLLEIAKRPEAVPVSERTARVAPR